MISVRRWTPELIENGNHRVVVLELSIELSRVALREDVLNDGVLHGI